MHSRVSRTIAISRGDQMHSVRLLMAFADTAEFLLRPLPRLCVTVRTHPAKFYYDTDSATCTEKLKRLQTMCQILDGKNKMLPKRRSRIKLTFHQIYSINMTMKK